MDETIHIPVMLSEVIDHLDLKRGDTIVDATLGGGGHAMAILNKILPGGRLIAFDADQSAIDRFQMRLEKEETFKNSVQRGEVILLHKKFSDIKEALREKEILFVSGVVVDLGLSSDQLEDATRGFSFLREGPLDMRFDADDSITADDIVNRWDASAIAKIFVAYGDIRESGRLARAIVERRKEKLFSTTTELAEFVKNISHDRHSSIHPATKVFQALRIAVNGELDVLEKFLGDVVSVLEKGRRIGVISFHSGEDAMVKRVFQADARGCVCPRDFPVCRCGKEAKIRVITKRPIVPSEEECQKNPRARSAKFRVAERI